MRQVFQATHTLLLLTLSTHSRGHRRIKLGCPQSFPSSSEFPCRIQRLLLSLSLSLSLSLTPFRIYATEYPTTMLLLLQFWRYAKFSQRSGLSAINPSVRQDKFFIVSVIIIIIIILINFNVPTGLCSLKITQIPFSRNIVPELERLNPRFGYREHCPDHQTLEILGYHPVPSALWFSSSGLTFPSWSLARTMRQAR